MPEEERLLDQPVELDRDALAADRPSDRARPEVRQLRSLMEIAVARRSLGARQPVRYRHQRAAQLFHMRPRRAEVPAPLLRKDVFFPDPWWELEEVAHAGEEPDPSAPARADGAVVVSETRDRIGLLDGREVTQARQVLLSPTGRRFKEFLVIFPDGSEGSFGDIPHRLLPLHGVDEPQLGAASQIVVCEGIKAAQALLDRGVAAVGTLTGALGTPARMALEPLVARQVPLILWPDNDDVGVQHMARVAQRLHDLGSKEIRVLRWMGAARKADAADFAGTDADMQRLIEQARPWTPDTHPRHRGVLAVNPTVAGLRLQMPPEERPPAPRLGESSGTEVQGPPTTEIITQLETIVDRGADNEPTADEVGAQLNRLLNQLRASMENQEGDDANPYRR